MRNIMAKATAQISGQRVAHTVATATLPTDDSIPPGLAWWKAYAAWSKANSERDEFEGDLREKHPSHPAELELTSSTGGGPQWLTDDDIRLIPNLQQRQKLLQIFCGWKSECRRVDREAGLPEMEYRTNRLSDVEEAHFTLWMETPATSIQGVALKLRAWRIYATCSSAKPACSDVASLTALADAERLCGVSVTQPTAWLKVAEYAALTIEEFGGGRP
jgi:hypothetical protein